MSTSRHIIKRKMSSGKQSWLPINLLSYYSNQSKTIVRSLGAERSHEMTVKNHFGKKSLWFLIGEITVSRLKLLSLYQRFLSFFMLRRMHVMQNIQPVSQEYFANRTILINAIFQLQPCIVRKTAKHTVKAGHIPHFKTTARITDTIESLTEYCPSEASTPVRADGLSASLSGWPACLNRLAVRTRPSQSWDSLGTAWTLCPTDSRLHTVFVQNRRRFYEDVREGWNFVIVSQFVLSSVKADCVMNILLKKSALAESLQGSPLSPFLQNALVFQPFALPKRNCAQNCVDHNPKIVNLRERTQISK